MATPYPFQPTSEPQRSPPDRIGSGNCFPGDDAASSTATGFTPPFVTSRPDPLLNDQVVERFREAVAVSSWPASFATPPPPPSSRSHATPPSPKSSTPAQRTGNDENGNVLMDAFLRTRSRAIRIHGLPEGTTRASLGGWLASASSITDFQGAAPSTWKVVESIWKEEEGDGGGGGWRVVLAEHATARDALGLDKTKFLDSVVFVSPALEGEPSSPEQAGSLTSSTAPRSKHRPTAIFTSPPSPNQRPPSLSQSIASASTLSPDSPTFHPSAGRRAPQHLDVETEEQTSSPDFASPADSVALDAWMMAGGLPFNLSSNPLPPANLSFRQGDWICPSDTCSFHNFARNEQCISCGALKPTSTTGSRSMPASASCSSSFQHRHQKSSPSPLAQARSPMHRHLAPLATMMGNQLPPASPEGFRLARSPSSSPATIFAPAAAGGGLPSAFQQQYSPPSMSVPTFSTSPIKKRYSAPLETSSFMYPGGGGVTEDAARRRSDPVVPIINTGNHGSMVIQQGDWACGECGFVNWRRRRVCLRCFPFAEGNEVAGVGLATYARMAAELARDTNVTTTAGGARGDLSSPPSQPIAPSPSTLSPPNLTPHHPQKQQQPTTGGAGYSSNILYHPPVPPTSSSLGLSLGPTSLQYPSPPTSPSVNGAGAHTLSTTPSPARSTFISSGPYQPPAAPAPAPAREGREEEGEGKAKVDVFGLPVVGKKFGADCGRGSSESLPTTGLASKRA